MASKKQSKKQSKQSKKPTARAAKARAKPKAKSAKPKAKSAKPKAKSAKPKAKASAKPKAKASAKPKAKAKPAARKSAASKPAASKPAASKPAARKPAAAGDGLLGKSAPAFELDDHTGARRSSKALAGKPYVLYFYPKDDTPGCTREACDFRDGIGAFARAGAEVLGVSPDSSSSHARFAEKYGLPFTLLADPDKSLATAYGVWAKKQNYGREYMGIVRSTFLVDARGVVRRAWRGVKVDGHADAVLAALGEL